MKVVVNEIAFDKMLADEAADKVVLIINSGRSGYVVTPNTEIMARSKNTACFNTLSGADIVLCDGIGISAIALINGKILRRTTGIELAEKVLEKATIFNLSVFLYGAEEGVAEKARENLEQIYCGINIVGTCNGFVSEEHAQEMIRKSGASIVFVCTSSPKQEFFAQNAATQAQKDGDRQRHRGVAHPGDRSAHQ